MNIGIFAGRVGKDAVLRHTQAGKPVLGFSVAVDVYVGGGEKETLWVDCSMWGERGQKVADYVTKGSSVTVQGRITLDSYEGNPKLKLDVQELTLQGGKQGEGDGPSRTTNKGGQKCGAEKPARAVPQSNDPFGDDIDDVPF